MPSVPHPHPRRPRRPGLFSVRFLLPGGLLLAALVFAIVGPRGLAPGLVAASFLVVVADQLIRLALGSEIDRDAERGARRRFRRTGRWPEDDDRDPPRPPS